MAAEEVDTGHMPTDVDHAGKQDDAEDNMPGDALGHIVDTEDPDEDIPAEEDKDAMHLQQAGLDRALPYIYLKSHGYSTESHLDLQPTTYILHFRS